MLFNALLTEICAEFQAALRKYTVVLCHRIACAWIAVCHRIAWSCGY